MKIYLIVPMAQFHGFCLRRRSFEILRDEARKKTSANVCDMCVTVRNIE